MNANFCPNCGHRVYQHSVRGCLHVETTGHIVKLDDKGWTLKHPMAERMNDKLFDCKIHVELTTFTEWPKAGVYAVVEEDDSGYLTFEPEDKARTPCDCTESFLEVS